MRRLGKTLESLSFLAYLKTCRPEESGQNLIIVPKSTSSNWVREVTRWVPCLSVMRFHGNYEERKQQEHEIPKYDVVVTTYEMVTIASSILKKTKWNYLYIDEAHRIKNEKSKLAIIVRTIPSKRRLLITGTPLQNNLRVSGT